MTSIDTNVWERSSLENWESPTPNSLKMKVNQNHDYIVSNVNYENYALSSDISIPSGDDDGIGVVFDFLDSSNYKYIMYQGGGLNSLSSLYLNSPVTLVEVKDGVFKALSKSSLVPYWNQSQSFNIRLENLFSDISFYIDGIKVISYKKDNVVSGKIGFVTQSQITNFDNIVMEKASTNRFSAKYVLYAVEDDDQLTEITVKQYAKSEINTEISAKVFGVDNKDTDINIMYRGNSDIYTEIQPYGHNSIETELEVRPHNRMLARYEVQQPPVITDINNPTRDAFVRSEGVYATINNGGGSSMVVGKEGDYVWDSYLRFDLSHLTDSLTVLGTKLRLHYTGMFPQLDIRLYEVVEDWQEYSITYLNNPRIFREIGYSYERNIANKYIEIDVSSIALEWIANPNKNFGLYIKVADHSNNGQMIFRTRESVSPPELIVKYYSTDVFSTGRSDLQTEIRAMKADYSQHNTEVEVTSAFAFSRMETEIYCHRREVPLDVDINTEITSNKVYEYAELTVSIVEESDVRTELSVLSDVRASSVNAEVVVSRPFNYVEIYSAHMSEQATQITVSNDRVYSEITASIPLILTEVSSRLSRYNEVDTAITVSNDRVLTEIDVIISNDVEVEIEIIGVMHDEVFTEITVSNYIVEAEVVVRLSRYIDYFTEITANRPFTYVEIRTPEQSNMKTEIDVLPQSSKNAEITVSRDTSLVEITPRAYSESAKESVIYVKYTSFVETEITAKSVSQIPVSIDVKVTSNVETEITVSNDRLFVEITPRVEGKYEVLAELLPRISTVSNIDVTITVGGRRGAYGFVM